MHTIPRYMLLTVSVFLLMLLLIAVPIIGFSNIEDFELPQNNVREITFIQDNHRLQGTLITASAEGPVVLLVHGDGAQDRWSSDSYLPLVNTLVDAGISVFSWDKPGVGASEGNWQHQSMQNRADETVAALTALRKESGFEHRSIGLLGFSQGGWVLPRVPALTDDVSFLVIIGGAINWQDQGQYYAATRMQREGKNPTEIAAELAQQKIKYREWFGHDTSYDEYIAAEALAGTPQSQILSKDRFQFAQLNYWEDARGDISKLTLPVLVLSGADDLNVDSQETVSIYTTLLDEAHSHNKFSIVANATHSLLSAQYYNYQLPEQWPLHAQARFVLSGRKAYAAEVLLMLTDWIHNVPD